MIEEQTAVGELYRRRPRQEYSRPFFAERQGRRINFVTNLTRMGFRGQVAKSAKERGIPLTAGTGYADKTWDGIAARVHRLHDHGIDMIFLQTPEYLFQLATQELLAKVRAGLPK